MDSIKDNLDVRRGTVIVVSVYGSEEGMNEENPVFKNQNYLSEVTKTFWQPDISSGDYQTTHVWISFQEDDLTFMDPIKLRGILEINIYKVSFNGFICPFRSPRFT